MIVSPRWRKLERIARTVTAAAGGDDHPKWGERHVSGKRALGVYFRSKCSLGASHVQSALGVGGQQLLCPGSLVRVSLWE